MERPAADPLAAPPRSRAVIRDVVLLHGLWMPSAIMRSLACRLAYRGYRPVLFDYRGRDDFAGNAARLAVFANRLHRPAHYVGHSLGGVLLLDALGADPNLPVGAVVLIAAPARGSESARRLARTPIGRWMLGRSRFRLCETTRPTWRRPEPLGIIGGTGATGIGRILGALTGDNDGVVCLTETGVDGCSDEVRFALGHTPLLFSLRVAEQIARFLEAGRFSRDLS